MIPAGANDDHVVTKTFAVARNRGGGFFGLGRCGARGNKSHADRKSPPLVRFSVCRANELKRSCSDGRIRTALLPCACAPSTPRQKGIV
jgi:hypothetical protein